MPRPYPSVFVTNKGEKFIKSGHFWVYGQEVTSVSGEYEQGDLVDVYTSKGSWLGTGFINDTSKIRVRIFSKNANDKFDFDFWKRRVRYALEYRKHVLDDISACRLIYGESDGFPGFTVDKYENLIVTQVLCLGMDRIRDTVYRAVAEVLSEEGINISGILERFDVAVREKEGLSEYRKFYAADWLCKKCGRDSWTPEDAVVRISENGILYDIDCLNGQKTGYFLDQRINRYDAGKISAGLNVLDCFCNIGGFSLNCGKNGAKSVVGADISEIACRTAENGAKLNGLDEKVRFITVDVFDYLTELASSKKCPYEMIILDPPAFTKSRETADNAYKGYKDINYRAMRALPRGGYLVSCSCSHFMTEEMFERMLLEAALDAKVQLKLVEKRLACPDHPVLFGVPETEYLKFYILQVS